MSPGAAGADAGSGPAEPRRSHVVLVGMMGVGKSTVGGRVAAALRRPFSDSDVVIESITGRTVAQIFATDGEPAFRALESQVLAAVLDLPEPQVVAAAGGVVLDPANREALRSAGTVVWLRAPADELAQRVVGSTHRPLLEEDPEAVLTRLAEQRRQLYAEVADVEVDASLPVDAVVGQVLDVVHQREAHPVTTATTPGPPHPDPQEAP